MSIKHSTDKGSFAKQGWVMLAVTVITIVIVWFLWLTRPLPQATLAELPPFRVVTVPVELSSSQPYETVTGRLQPQRTAILRFEVEGQVQRRKIEPGRSVTTGEVLLELQAEDYRDQVRQARAELAVEQQSEKRDRELLDLMQANLLLQQQEIKRFEQLSTSNLVAGSQLDKERQRLLEMRAEEARLQFQLSTAAARLQMKTVALETAQRKLDRTQLRAPFDGIVNAVSVEAGDFVLASQEVVELIDTHAMDLLLNIRGSIMNALALDQTIDIQVGSSGYAGKVIALQIDPDISTNTHQVRIRIPGKRWLAGKLATARLPLAPEQTHLRVPVSSVIHLRDSAHVFVLNAGHVYKTPVQLGYRIDQYYTVTAGLSQGDQVVAKDVGSLTDGQPVVIATH